MVKIDSVLREVRGPKKSTEQGEGKKYSGMKNRIQRCLWLSKKIIDGIIYCITGVIIANILIKGIQGEQFRRDRGNRWSAVRRNLIGMN